LEALLNGSEETGGSWTIEIGIMRMFKIDDIYGDGSLVKKVFRKAISTAKPDKVSEVQFDLWIYNGDVNKHLEIPSEDRLIWAS